MRYLASHLFLFLSHKTLVKKTRLCLYHPMLKISDNISIPADEIIITAIRSGGPGGQRVNKVSTAIHLRFNIRQSSLPDFYKEKLLKLNDQRITAEGVIIIKAQQFRTQEKNRQEALDRLMKIITDATTIQKSRRPTKPSKNSQRRRMDKKVKRGITKSLRGKVSH